MTTGGKDEIDLHRIIRITDIVKEPLEFLLPITGYEQMPLVSLEEAVDKIVHILPFIQTYAHIAKERCKNPADKLTQDESAAIMLYTMGWHPYDKCLYYVFNSALRSKNRETLIPWFSYLKLFLYALSRLPSYTQMVFRGMKLNLNERYINGNTILWWGFSSCTSTMKILETEIFFDKTNERTMFIIECLNGKNIRKHSYFSKEDEILLLPATHFKVISVCNQGNLHTIRLKEIQPRIPLLNPIIISLADFKSGNKTEALTSVNVSETYRKDESSTNQTLRTKKHTKVTDENLTQPRKLSLTDTSSNTSTEFIGHSPLERFRRHTVTSQTEQINTKTSKWKQYGIIVAGRSQIGNQSSHLSHPHGIVIDNEKSIYIADSYNHRIVEWKYNMTHGKTITDENGTNQIKQLKYPIDLVYDKKNNSFIISDWGNRRVIRWFHQNKTNSQILISNIDCYGVTIDKNGFIYVSDYKKNEVRQWKEGDSDGKLVAGGNGQGNGLHQFSWPGFIFVDEDCSLYISDCSNHRVMKWKKDAKQGIIVAGGNGRGKSLKRLWGPQGVIVNPFGQIYIADSWNNRIVCWREGDSQGSIIVDGNENTRGSNKLTRPVGISFDDEGNLYVADCLNHRIQKYEIDFD
ncbi:unnamed protein product [Adineta steineri]|uniref:NAD(P)(+)--arginine ADP-ribosyltransferase n=1 Tax=Adineta steineri TaxID=433720 RepID=A0A813Y4F2_9BILA|nr:unnamed protein product [Adineta steineri]CAF3746216.1 unnamed protein product [Adineta steineri]